MKTSYSFFKIKSELSNLSFLKILLFSLLMAIVLFSQLLLANEKEITPSEKMVSNISWLGQAAVKITAMNKIIYIDPYRIKEKDKADIILITHDHSDHFSPNDISKISTEKSMIIAPAACKKALEDMDISSKIFLQPNEKTEIDGITVEAVPAYNIVKTGYHPKSNKWLGYILTIDGIRIYHAGDTERIPEMKNFNTDISILPLGQTYTMNSVEEAVEAALDTKAKIAIPMHFGLYEGKKEDAEKFKELLEEIIKVIILEEE